MLRTASLLLIAVLCLLTLPAHPQLGAPLGRCGPQPHDVDWPQNHLPEDRATMDISKKAAVDVGRLQRDAQELADLSASIHADVDRANRGFLSKDVLEKLKRVEKLSKQLRSELMRP